MYYMTDRDQKIQDLSRIFMNAATRHGQFSTIFGVVVVPKNLDDIELNNLCDLWAQQEMEAIENA